MLSMRAEKGLTNPGPVSRQSRPRFRLGRRLRLCRNVPVFFVLFCHLYRGSNTDNCAANKSNVFARQAYTEEDEVSLVLSAVYA